MDKRGRLFILFITTSLPFLLWVNSSVYAIAGNLNIETSAATSSGWLVLGNEKSLRSAFGPLILDYKSDPDTWSAGLVIREVTGNVGIGTSSPTSKLKVNGAIEAASFIDSANPTYYLDPANGTNSLVVAGSVGIGTATPSAKLDVSGNAVLGATTLTDTLTLSNDANEGITGGGLTNCTGSTNKLLWDQSTNKFSCGTDQAGNEVFIEKDADEIVNNSSTLQNDDDLTFTMAANTAYGVEASIRYTSVTGSPDFKYAFTIPSGATMNLTGQGFNSATSLVDCRIITSGTACALTGNAAPDWPITIHGIVQTAGTAGAFQFQWAQNNATNENTTVKKNSWMRMTPLSGAADLAEIYETDDQTLSAGEIVAIDPVKASWVKKSQTAYEKMLLGVVSTKPAQLMGTAATGGIPVPVALSGRVPVKIAPDSAPIAPGDFLTSSNTPGLAMKATKTGSVFAKALEFWSCQSSVFSSQLSDNGQSVIGQSVSGTDQPTTDKPKTENGQPKTDNCTDQIEAFIHLGFYNPLLTLTDTGDLDIVNTIGLQKQEIKELRTMIDRLQEKIDQQEFRIRDLEAKVFGQQ